MQKLILMLVCTVTIGTSAPALGADYTHERNPKLDSTQQEQPAPPKAMSQGSDAAQRTPTHTSAEEELEQTEKRCSHKIVAAVDCQPPPGSPLSAFPLVSYTNPPLEGNQQ